MRTEDLSFPDFRIENGSNPKPILRANAVPSLNLTDVSLGACSRGTDPLALRCSERQAHRDNPAMVVLVKVRRGDLQTTANAEMQSLRQWKASHHESRRQE